MKRQLSTNLVVLPHLDAYSAMTVIRGMITRIHTTIAQLAKDKKKLPPLVAKAAVALEATYTALQLAISSEKPQPEARDPKAVHADVINAWGALYDWLAAFARLKASTPEREQAEVVRNRVFADGLAFVKLKYAQAWAAGEAKLVAAREAGAETAALPEDSEGDKDE